MLKFKLLKPLKLFQKGFQYLKTGKPKSLIPIAEHKLNYNYSNQGHMPQIIVNVIIYVKIFGLCVLKRS